MIGYLAAILVAAILLTDFILLKRKGLRATFSAWVVRTTKAWPIITLLIGVLCGHFWFPYCECPTQEELDAISDDEVLPEPLTEAMPVLPKEKPEDCE